MATCLTNEPNPLTSVPSFTLKPREEKCTDDLSSAAPLTALLPPSSDWGLRIRSSFDEDEVSPSIRLAEAPAPVPSVTVEPPPWAVCASGEARLEPVGPTASTHHPVDLSTSIFFRFGRSLSSDVRLLHPTSSRKHALIFHHPNGCCYVVDCGSAHGTYVNGVRVGGPVVQQGTTGRATATPHRVRRGALVRFGGPGAPTFVLKSFSASLEGLVRELCGEKQNKTTYGDIVPVENGACSPTTAEKPAKGECPSPLPTLSPTTPRACTLPQTTQMDELKDSIPCSPSTALVALNTRVNALGGGALLNQKSRAIAQRAASKLVTGAELLEQIDSCLLGKRCRSEAMDYSSEGEFSTDHTSRQSKRLRSATFPLSPETTRSCLKIQDIPSNLLQTPLISQQLLTNLTVEFMGKNEERRKVKFQEATQQFYPASVTPDEGSFDDEHPELTKQ